MHQYYCDIDLYAKQMYTCIIDNNGHKLMHRQRVTRLCGENERASNISSQTRCLAIEDARQRASSHPRYLFATGSAGWLAVEMGLVDNFRDLASKPKRRFKNVN